MSQQPAPAPHIRDEIRFKRPQPWLVRALIVFPGAALSLLMMLIVIAWLVGRFASDRYAWSQWLLWIPTPLALLACAMCILLAFRATMRPRSGRLRAFLWLLALIGIAVYFGLIEHHMLRRTPNVDTSAKSIRIAHWNMGPATSLDVPNCVAAMQRLGADITFITDPAGITDHALVKDWLGEGIRAPSLGTLAVFTRLPIISFQPIISHDGMLAVVVKIDTTSSLGRPLTVYMVDMPSGLRRPRMELARKFHAMLTDADPPLPDLVVGDFNITRESQSLKTMFPHLRHAYELAGAGYAATFHGEFPLWHIDHMLLGPSMRAMSYQIVNTGYGRHRAQIAVIGLRK